MKKRFYLDPLPRHDLSLVSSYVAGFLISLALTVGAFSVVGAYVASDGVLFSRQVIVLAIAVLAIIQLIVQGIFFLHLSTHKHARPTVHATAFTVIMGLILVVGSLWIMHNLNYNMMPEHQQTEYIEDEENIYKDV